MKTTIEMMRAWELLGATTWICQDTLKCVRDVIEATPLTRSDRDYVAKQLIFLRFHVERAIEAMKSIDGGEECIRSQPISEVIGAGHYSEAFINRLRGIGRSDSYGVQ